MQVDVSLHDHLVEDCKRVIVDMCSPVLSRHLSGTTFTDLFLQSIQSPGSEFIVKVFPFCTNSHFCLCLSPALGPSSLLCVFVEYGNNTLLGEIKLLLQTPPPLQCPPLP